MINLVMNKNGCINYNYTKNNSEILRLLIVNSLIEQGFKLDKDSNILITKDISKDEARALHKSYRRDKLLKEKLFLKNNLYKLEGFFANGKDIDPLNFQPSIIPVEGDTEYSRLFRLATLIWSVPVSQGFGRRVRFLVIDEHNSKLVGIFALGDPVFNLKIRDQWIGWDHNQRASKLYNVMDLFILGAVPPYSNLLCGKLVAMIAVSDIVQKYIYYRYQGRVTTIKGEQKNPQLGLITTTSALGRSSIYNRIKFHEKLIFLKIGQTQGWGHFHLGNGTFELMRRFLKENKNPVEKRNRFGQGPNWKMRAARTCLSLLGLSPNLLRHGIKRDFYAIPLANNFREYLLGQSEELDLLDFNSTDLVQYFKNRWFFPRIERFPDFIKIKANETLKDFYELI